MMSGNALLDDKYNFVALSINNLQDGLNLIKEKFIKSTNNIDEII